MIVNQNSDFLYLFHAALSNPNGDPDQENKPRMDYETSTALVSDARRKRDIRDFLKEKGFSIFVDTLSEQKVPMDKMFYYIRDSWLGNKEKMDTLFADISGFKKQWADLFGTGQNYLEAYLKYIKGKAKKDKEFTRFNNEFLTEIIKRELIDIRLFGSAMAVEGVSKTFTGPIQMNWGYSLHPVEIIKSSTITSIMNEDSSTFGKKYKLHYALIAHYGTINKYSAEKTGLTDKDREIFRKALIQSIMANQTDSKQGQEPLAYIEIVYKDDFDGYLGDLRRFIDVEAKKDAIRSIDDIILDFNRLKDAINGMMTQGYVNKVLGWTHPFIRKEHLINMPEYENEDLWTPIKMEG